MKHRREWATGVAMIAAVASVSAQTTPPPEPQTPPEEQTAPQATKPEPVLPSFSIGWTSWSLNGNEHKFRQYATSARGLYIREIAYAPAFQDGRHDGTFTVRTPGEEDWLLNGLIRLGFGTTYLAGSMRRNEFFDPTPVLINPSQRKVSEAFLRQNVSSNISVSVRARMDEQDVINEPPLDPLHQRTRFWNGTAQGSLWTGGFVSLSFTDWRYWDRSNVLPDTETKRWTATLSQELTPGLSIDGHYSKARVKVPAQALTNQVESWGFGADWDIGVDTTLLFDYRKDDLDLPTVTNAYVTNRSITRGRVVQRIGRWSAQVGYSRMELERLRADQSFIDVPKWHTFEAQVSGRINPSLRISARGVRSTMQGGAVMQMNDPRAAYWRNRWSANVKLDAVGPEATGYLVFGLASTRNDVRDTTVRNQSLTIGGTFQSRPDLQLYAEATTDVWSGRTADIANPDLQAYFPDGKSLVLGASWTPAPHIVASANFTHFATANANPLGLRDGNVRGSFFTGSFTYRVPAGIEFGLTVAPWSYSDRMIPQLGYNTGLVSLFARAKF